MLLNTKSDVDKKELMGLLQLDTIDQVSQQLLGLPYKANCLGEGVAGEFDQQPVYRLDCFDCVTYVNTVIALASSHSVNEFTHTMAKINYRDGNMKYTNRHHFMSIDWNVCNQKIGLVKDVTQQLGITPIEYAQCAINKPAWYQAKTLADIKCEHVAYAERARLLASLQAKASCVDVEKSRLPYISIQNLLSAHNQQVLCQAMPEIAIVEIVRPAWDLRASIGTHLNVSHVGFAVKTRQGLQFRHASLVAGQVVACDLFSYLAAYKQHSTIKGIHVLAYLG